MKSSLLSSLLAGLVAFATAATAVGQVAYISTKYDGIFISNPDGSVRPFIAPLEVGGWGYSLAYSPQGELVVSSGRGLRVFDGTTGAFLREIVRYNFNVSQPIAYSPSGELYVGTPQGVIRAEDLSVRNGKYLTEPYGVLTDMAFDTKGLLWLGIPEWQSVMSFDVALKKSVNYGYLPQGQDTFRYPHAIAPALDGTLLVADNYDKSIRRYGFNPASLSLFWRGVPLLSSAEAMYVAPNGNVFIMDTLFPQIIELTPDRQFVRIAVNIAGYFDDQGLDFDKQVLDFVFATPPTVVPNVAVPEPSTYALGAGALLVLLAWRRKAQRVARDVTSV
jgi:hypothetical protein